MSNESNNDGVTPHGPYVKTKISENQFFGMKMSPITANNLMHSSSNTDWEAGRLLSIDAAHIAKGCPPLD